MKVHGVLVRILEERGLSGWCFYSLPISIEQRNLKAENRLKPILQTQPTLQTLRPRLHPGPHRLRTRHPLLADEIDRLIDPAEDAHLAGLEQ